MVFAILGWVSMSLGWLFLLVKPLTMGLHHLAIIIFVSFGIVFAGIAEILNKLKK